ncbi:uncharacterized protein CLUP02_13471 [Colletotrichum lupini]|uniref:Uncharacterized protein n=1 Tax=Colletotrichum lupini TaxID=145971 RepID=A0A9Q8WMC7_9PEZI|nr:uncharacterized protein CLUP02_13471 [Colletotrichum lupini]UQC87950.1 hypothetical protein CLUP02_13471 [Colletotrichum lupini]
MAPPDSAIAGAEHPPDPDEQQIQNPLSRIFWFPNVARGHQTSNFQLKPRKHTEQQYGFDIEWLLSALSRQVNGSPGPPIRAKVSRFRPPIASEGSPCFKHMFDISQPHGLRFPIAL